MPNKIQIDWTKDRHYKTINNALGIIHDLLNQDEELEFYKSENGVEFLENLKDDLKEVKLYINKANKHEV
jgi:uncharacterized protein YwgA